MNTYLFGSVFSIICFVFSLQVYSQNCDIVYISPSGSGLLGTVDNPTSIIDAGEIYSADLNRNIFHLLEGVYNLNTKLSLPSNVTLEGGFTILGGDGWTKNSNSITILNINPSMEIFENAGHYIGIELMSTNNVVLKDLQVNVMIGQNAGVYNDQGASIYGIYAHSSTNYTIERCYVNTGLAGNGLNGVNGGSGADGGNGNHGQIGCDGCNSLGAGGNGGFGANSGGFGGNGGYGNTNGGTGQNGFGSGGGAGAAGGSGDDSTCAFGCSNGGSGNSGGQGLNGASGANGANGIGAWINGYYVPNTGNNGFGGFGGAGGGGGGGGGGSACCLDDKGAGGGGGGGGGYPGTGGLGGGGGGSSVAIFIWNNGSGTELIDCILNPGPVGNGGFGGIGGNGGNGGASSNGGSPADNGGPGGGGGPGGTGGQGGNGGIGSTGEAWQLFQNGVAVIETDTAWPLPHIFAANYHSGCTNSEITITKEFGVWDMNAMVSVFINDLDPNTSSFTSNMDEVKVSYSSVGYKSLVTDQENINDFIFINDLRPIPTINSNPDSICQEELIFLGTDDTGLEYDWRFFNSTMTQLQVYNVQNPGALSAQDEGMYYIKFQVKDQCCGWSVPVWDSVYVREEFSSINLVHICQNDSVFLEGAWQNTGDLYVDTLINSFGCESIVNTVLFIDNCLEFGCTDPEALNYNSLALNDDGSCVYQDFTIYCGEGTVWNEELQQCVIYCQPDLNFDGLINTSDLLAFLSVFGLSCEDIE